MHPKTDDILSKKTVINNRELLNQLIKIKNGDFSVSFPSGMPGIEGSIYTVLNEIIAQNKKMSLKLKRSDTNISKQELLQKVNEELKDEAVLLAAQKKEIELKNKEVEEARRLIEEKANQLALTSKYKSEFLANMSHELRTPLNSLQILAHELIENHEGNLNQKQIQFAKTIKACGEELIDLINDILDLTKIESGYISINYSAISFNEITTYVDNTFRLISKAKQLEFVIETEKSLPEFIETDSQRLYQILKNLLSNSFKFTEKGRVKLKIYNAGHNWRTKVPSLDKAAAVIAFEISDTGIGISEDKQNLVFEAFQQAEGSTSRKYGGTGLGLSISRGLSELLGGVIELESIPEQGSTFTLFLPLKTISKNGNIKTETKNKIKLPNDVKSPPPTAYMFSDVEQYFINEADDDRNNVLPDDKVILIIDDDIESAKLTISKAHEHKTKAVAITNANQAIDFINQFHPHAIIMNIYSNHSKKWKIMDRIKADLNLRHIPLYVISDETNKNTAFKKGARFFLPKYLKTEKSDYLFNDILDFSDKKTKHLLIADNNEDNLNNIINAIDHTDIKILKAGTANEITHLISKYHFDCIILNPALPDINDHDLTNILKKNREKYPTALILYSEESDDSNEITKLKQLANATIIKSPLYLLQLVDHVALFSHRLYKNLPQEMKSIIYTFYLSDNILQGKKVLIVDDDMRNLFALTNSLERYGLKVSNAESGQECLEILEKQKDFDLVLMDIMMPGMDGYETIKRIRKKEKDGNQTIIAVTAKAMKGDREKCIVSGASDYITKPVIIEQLLCLMRMWLK